MLVRMESGRFKAFKHLNDWFEEFRLYHRKDGKVHKEGDDLMAATRYAVMMLRFARHRRITATFIGGSSIPNWGSCDHANARWQACRALGRLLLSWHRSCRATCLCRGHQRRASVVFCRWQACRSSDAGAHPARA